MRDKLLPLLKREASPDVKLSVISLFIGKMMEVYDKRINFLEDRQLQKGEQGDKGDPGKDGGAFGSIAPTVTERGDGWYALALTASHTDTLGDLALHITGTAADPADMVLLVEAGATDADVSTRLATAGYTAPPSAADNAVAVLAAAQAAPLAANIKKVNDVTVDGTGALGNEWGPA